MPEITEKFKFRTEANSLVGRPGLCTLPHAACAVLLCMKTVLGPDIMLVGMDRDGMTEPQLCPSAGLIGQMSELERLSTCL